MDLSLVSLDVDGTLRNPLVLAVVLAFAIILGVATGTIVLLWHRGERGRRTAALLLPFLAIVGIANVPLVQFVVSVVYKVTAQHGVTVGVGFFGHHPAWIIPLFSIAGGVLARVRLQIRPPAVA